MYRIARPGLDLSSAFIDDLKSIDKDFHIIWHPYRCLWDIFINTYYGEIENPRYTIGESYGKTVFGFVLTDNNSCPIPENRWHIWRWCPSVRAYAHVIDIASTEPSHLRKIVEKIARAAMLANMPHKERMKFLQDEQEEELQRNQKKGQDLWKDTQKANSKLMRDVAENFSYGRTAPTNPTKDIIASYKGQVNRSRISRTITDKEGGIISPYEE